MYKGGRGEYLYSSQSPLFTAEQLVDIIYIMSVTLSNMFDNNSEEANAYYDLVCLHL
jgi:hypothetical protein